MFKKYNLPVPVKNYNNVVNWIKIFNPIKITDFKTREIIYLFKK